MLKRKRIFFEEICNRIPLPIVFLKHTSDDFTIAYMNSAAEELVAIRFSDLANHTLGEALPELDKNVHVQLREIFIRGERASTDSVHYQNRLGEYFVLRLSIDCVQHGLLLSGENVLPRTKPLQVYHSSSYDSLTGILLRDQFLKHASEELLACQEESAGLLLIDLDCFKEINDSGGHAAGDRALRRSAQQISELVRYRDLIGRIGGDEMALLVPGAREDVAREVALRINKSLRRPTASIGITISPSEHILEEMILLADQAMYEAKELGGDRYRIKNP